MPDLDYGYEVTIAQNATFDPSGQANNQWQRQVSGNTNWEDIEAATSETYVVAASDRSAKIRLVQSLNGAEAYSNELKVTDKEFSIADGIGHFGDNNGRNKWSGGVLAPNGKIYAMPWNNGKVLEIDPVTETTRRVGDSVGSSFMYEGGVLGLNGKIYGCPHSADWLFEYDPETEQTVIFGDITDEKSSKWGGGVLAPNGKIYSVPHTAIQCLEVDPYSKTTRKFGPTSGIYTYSMKWKGAVLAKNGRIYGIPSNAQYILEINPSGRGVTHFGNVGSGSEKWRGGVLAPDGKIYGIPYNSPSVLEIDPDAKTFSTFGNVGEGKWAGGALGPNGKIYAIPHHNSATSILEIDPIEKTVEKIEIDIPPSNYTTYLWSGATLAANGIIYGIPYDQPGILKIDIGSSPASGPTGSETWPMPGLPGNVLDPRSAYFNKF